MTTPTQPWTLPTASKVAGVTVTSTAAPLPAYLRTSKDGALELVLHCTWVQDHDLCPQKFWLRYGEQVEAAASKAALVYGGAVHEALRVRYEAERDGASFAEAAMNAALEAHFAKTPQPDGEWRDCGRAQALIAAYNEQYSTHEWEVLAVEEEFEVVVGVVTIDQKAAYEAGTVAPSNRWVSVPVYLHGTKDLVVRWHDGLWVVDHKTATDWGSGDSNSHLDEGRMSFQFRGYPWAERSRQRKLIKEGEADMLDVRNRLPILGTVGNYLVSRKPYATDRPVARPTPRNQFHQEAFPFTDRQLDEWREECLGVASEILREHFTGVALGTHDHPTAFRRHRGACGHWGRCEFYEYCEASPEQRRDLLQSTIFKPRSTEPEV